MQRICSWCEAELKPYEMNKVENQFITNGLCSVCAENIFKGNDSAALCRFLDNIDAPVLLLQHKPRLVRSANQKARNLFGKDIAEIEGKRGGDVFSCIHAFSKEGCGEAKPCEKCKIKNSVIETLTTGTSFEYVFTFLDIKKQHAVTTYKLQVSTERVGNHALLRIDQFEKK
ncbi:MAG: hypothetical protein KQH63_11625 [Desulfobulbaceae bacterium]|nr:hypothetical protein [Desulfobulbaceae bacterium]